MTFQSFRKKYSNYFIYFKNKNCHVIKGRVNVEKNITKNPYLQSKALWNDIYGDVEERYRRTLHLNFLLAGIIGLLIVGFICIATETKIKPFPFILKGDQVFSVSESNTPSFNRLKSNLASHFAAQFIRAARAVSIDGDVNAENKITAYSFVGGDEAMQVLKDFYQTNNPDQLAQHQVSNITNVVVLPSASPNTLTVRWIEESRDVHSGALLKSVPYIAQLTYRYATPSTDSTILKTNPLGFYVTYLSWSSDQNN